MPNAVSASASPPQVGTPPNSSGMSTKTFFTQCVSRARRTRTRSEFISDSPSPRWLTAPDVPSGGLQTVDPPRSHSGQASFSYCSLRIRNRTASDV